MIFLVDTNVLLRMIQQSHPMYADARRAAASLTRQKNQVSITAQNLVEFWAVATRPESTNGLGLSLADTEAHVQTFKRAFTFLPDVPDIFAEWEKLVVLHSISGKQAHDTRLVAAMLAHNVTHLLTFNDRDFKRFSEITAVNPKDVPEEQQ